MEASSFSVGVVLDHAVLIGLAVRRRCEQSNVHDLSVEKVLAILATIHNFPAYLEAVVARSALEAHGIYAVIPDAYTASNAWHLTCALQGVRLCTIEADAAPAREILADGVQLTSRSGTLMLRDILVAALAFLIATIPHPIRRNSAQE